MRSRDPISDLRAAIDSLPVRAREAMLEGIRANPIVVGAYTDDNGGICPMLAAHRHGGRVTLLAFARSWDSFARARGVRRATRREMAILEGQLVASLLAEDDVDLQAAISEHAALRERRAATAADGAAARAAANRGGAQISARRLAPGGRIRSLRPRRDARRALARVQRDLAPSR